MSHKVALLCPMLTFFVLPITLLFQALFNPILHGRRGEGGGEVGRKFVAILIPMFDWGVCSFHGNSGLDDGVFIYSYDLILIFYGVFILNCAKY